MTHGTNEPQQDPAAGDHRGLGHHQEKKPEPEPEPDRMHHILLVLLASVEAISATFTALMRNEDPFAWIACVWALATLIRTASDLSRGRR